MWRSVRTANRPHTTELEAEPPMSGPARGQLALVLAVAAPLAHACSSPLVGAALGGAVYPPAVPLLRPEALAVMQANPANREYPRLAG